MSGRRLLLVHAHPDDESTATGATIAKYCAEGAEVAVVTCTSGELGDVVSEELAHLRGDPAALGERRRRELGEALAEYGPVRHHWLGGPGRWRDSGMPGEPGNTAEGAFAGADPLEVTRSLVEIVRAERPQVVVTYDDHGSYGHPDHIAASRAVMDALGPAADPDYAPELGRPWRVLKTYWVVLPRSLLTELEQWGVSDFQPYTVADEELTAVLDARQYHPVKMAALRRYRSQVDLDSDEFFTWMVSRPEFAIEHYLLVRGRRGPGEGEHGWETDLFAGLEV